MRDRLLPQRPCQPSMGSSMVPACCYLSAVDLHCLSQLQEFLSQVASAKLRWFSAGRDLIADSYAQPRSKAKPTFGPASRAAPASALHSTPHQRSWLKQQGQQPSEGASEQDAIEERRQSGQSASTSRQGDSRGRHKVPTSSKGSSRGPSPTSPFGSITMGSGRPNRAAAKKSGNAFETPTTLMHAMPESKAATTQDIDQRSDRHFTAAPAQASHEHWQTCGRQCDGSHGPPNQVCHSHAVVGADATDAGAPCEQARQVQSHQAQPGAAGSGGSRASSIQAADTAEHVLPGIQGRRNISNALPTSLVPNTVCALSEQPSVADSEPTSSALSDDPLNEASINSGRRQKKGRRHCKPGPSAFPQLPYERSLQLEQSVQNSASRSTDSEHDLPVSASDTAWQTSAQTDVLADAMQQRLQLQERRAEGPFGEGQEGPQQRLSQHGGYMQRGSQERLPRRRTARSMLRGADTQTGKKMVQHYRALHESCVSVRRPLLGDAHLHMLLVSLLLPVHEKLFCIFDQPVRLTPMCQG